jgi:hypothetical protein
MCRRNVDEEGLHGLPDLQYVACREMSHIAESFALAVTLFDWCIDSVSFDPTMGTIQ